ncbi:MAG: DUF4386 domain-containing protein [Chitinophagaceae bacterium]|nr:DUF4386 domain-containing protein [Chitinophagaceae bacterium]
MNTTTRIGWLLIAGALGVLLPYTALGFLFEYPAILRQPTGHILQAFQQGGPRLLLTWWAFALLGTPLLAAAVLLGQQLEQRHGAVRLATTLGVAGLLVQMIGLLRWTFVVPLLARQYTTGDEAARQAAIHSFELIHQWAGVLLGEHLGQLLSIGWTLLLTRALWQLRIGPRWLHVLATVASVVYAAAQTELLATVLPGTPVLAWAGLAGSSLWLLWLLALGTWLLRRRPALQ